MKKARLQWSRAFFWRNLSTVGLFRVGASLLAIAVYQFAWMLNVAAHREQARTHACHCMSISGWLRKINTPRIAI
ncbi:hypothetical protein PHLH4_05730 [Pseudomonas sp. St316]|nr:hypothetical protein PHLH4_05730 [Pseudomonas sp. St316]